MSLEQNLMDLLGLTKNEAKVYNAIINGNEINPTELARYLNIPRTRVYESLSNLSAKGLLKKAANNYYIIPPKSAITRIIEEKQLVHNNYIASVGELSNYLNDIWENSLSKHILPGVSLFTFEESEPMFFEHLKHVKNRVWIAAADHNPTINMRQAGTILSSIYHPKLDIKYLVADKKILEKIKFGVCKFPPMSHLNVHFKYNKDLHSSFVIIDNVLYVFFFGPSSTIQVSTMITASENLFLTFEYVYRHLWDMQDKVFTCEDN